MASFDTRKDEQFNKHLSATVEQRIARLVGNSQMPDSETNYHRGYIAACRDVAGFYNGELKTIMDKE